LNDSQIFASPAARRLAAAVPARARRRISGNRVVAAYELVDDPAERRIWSHGVAMARVQTARTQHSPGHICRTIELKGLPNMDELFKGRHFDREIIVLCVMDVVAAR
jgi:hypothetical protein